MYEIEINYGSGEPFKAKAETIEEGIEKLIPKLIFHPASITVKNGKKIFGTRLGMAQTRRLPNKHARHHVIRKLKLGLGE